MTTIKSYTDLEQSKKLAEILPLESADMSWILVNYGDEAGSRYEPSLATYKAVSFFRNRIFPKDHTIPCWSLAALLELIADKNCTWLGTDDVSAWRCVFNLGKGEHYETTEYATPIDACVAMIEKLNELNLL